MITGIIPAAGRGVRSQIPYPKELLPVTVQEGRVVTVIEGAIKQLANAGIHQAIVITRPEKQMIEDYLGSERFGVKLTYRNQLTMNSREGLPDAVTAGFCEADLCVMLMGDVYFTHPYVVHNLLYEMKDHSEAVAGVSTWFTNEPYRFGIVEHTGDITFDWVQGVTDKPDLPKGDLQEHWGAVAFRPAFWQYLFDEMETFSHALHRAATKEKVLCTLSFGQYLDFGNPNSIIEGIKAVNA